MTPMTGRHVLAMFVFGFGVIISVNLILAFNAVRTFPGLEVKNSYVASQFFDENRATQLALDWTVSASLDGDQLTLRIEKDGAPIAPRIETAIFGRPTSVAHDQTPDFRFNGAAYVAQVKAGSGNWNLRLSARAADGSLFQQRIVVEHAP